MAKKDYTNWDRKELIKEIDQLRKRKKYGLVWEDKPENVVEQCKTELPVLEEVKGKEIKTDSDKPMNLLIEGDNYHALSVLNYTHKGKIDVIYIDPPYNTGAKDWKYNNDYVDNNDMFRHSKWVSMMNNRLKLAKKLLKKDGVLICAIDDNESATLGLLLQEIFPDREIVGVVIIHNPAGVQGKNFSYIHEFAYFVYPKKGLFIGKTARDKELISPLRDWGGTSARKLAKTCFYPIIVKNNEIIGFGDVCSIDFHPQRSNVPQKDGSVYIYPIDKNGEEKKWVFSRKSSEENKDQLFCKIINKEVVIMRKKDQFTYRTVWDDKKYYANIYGSKLLNNIISAKFSFPKSLFAVEDCIKAVIHNKDNAIILDFFAGSGTTGHAVLELNSIDGGNRKFILCTNNEDNNGDGSKIATDICLPRIEKVIKGYKGVVDKKKYEGMGGNLKYFKTAFVPAEPTDKNKTALTKKATDMLCVKEDTFEKIKSNEQFIIYGNKKRYTGIIFDQQAIDDFKKEIAKIDGKFSVYVFSLGDDTFDEEFDDMKSKVKLSPIPEAILRVYRRIFK
ncbi:MAG: DNA methyltransferase [bacterium]|nr:DNA methyltransferase [bacterium]